MTTITLTDHIGDGHFLIARDGVPIGTADLNTDWNLIVATVQVGNRFRRRAAADRKRLAALIADMFDRRPAVDTSAGWTGDELENEGV